jgi:hypothetical protein
LRRRTAAESEFEERIRSIRVSLAGYRRAPTVTSVAAAFEPFTAVTWSRTQRAATGPNVATFIVPSFVQVPPVASVRVEPFVLTTAVPRKKPGKQPVQRLLAATLRPRSASGYG